MNAVPSLREVSSGLYGAWRFALLDRAAMLWFDRSIAGVARSFWAAVLAYPGFMLLTVMQIEPAAWDRAGALHILLLESVAYVILWTGFPLVILGFCRWLQREEQSLRFIIAYNWAQVLQVALMVGVLLVERTLALPLATAGALDLASIAAVLAYEWFIARTALQAGGAAATAVVLIDVVLATAMGRLTQSLY